MKRLVISIGIIFLLILSAEAAPIGSWTLHLAYQNATDNIPAGKRVYSLYDGNLLVYNTETTEIDFLSKNTGLSDKNIRHMAYSSNQKCLVIVYDNCNIDLLYHDGDVVNLPQVKNSAAANHDATGVTVTGSDAIVSTQGGLVHLDLKNQMVKTVYTTSEPVYSAAVFDGYIYSATSSTVMRGRLTDNLLDNSNWQPVRSLSARKMVVFAGALYLSSDKTDRGLWRLASDVSEGGGHVFTKISDTYFACAHADEKQAVFGGNTEILCFTSDNPAVPSVTVRQNNSWNAVTRFPNGLFWVSDGFNGLCSYNLAGGQLVATGQSIGGYGPRRDLAYKLNYAGDRLLVAGGRIDYSGKNYPGTAVFREGNDWHTFQEEGISAADGIPYQNVTSVAQDPSDAAHHYVSTSTGVYEFRDFKFVRHYDSSNSSLAIARGAGGNKEYVMTSGLTYDDSGNLWMVNYEADTVLHVLKPDGSWKGIYVSDVKLVSTPEHILFDRRGRLWMTSRRWTRYLRGGFLCLDYNGTIDNTKDDLSTFRYGAYNQDGAFCDFSQAAYAMMEDDDGAIWLGTDAGLFVVSDPDTWSSPDFRITQIKVPRNDGTNYADYLLSGVAVTAITRDGAGRKWIGTSGNGLYLVSRDGTEIISHFTADNSPLLSNDIYSVAVAATTGEVMIATRLGLCSYQSDASLPSDNLVRKNIKVYPNPVRPEHAAGVVISGLTAEADVKVTTAAGRVVAAGTSNGGTFTWNCRAADGGRVASGVYYIMVATADGKSGIAAKVVVI